MVTFEQVMMWHPKPCYEPDRIQKLFAGREYLHAQDIFDLPIPDIDKIWTLLHKEFIDFQVALSILSAPRHTSSFKHLFNHIDDLLDDLLDVFYLGILRKELLP